jgi:cytochrome b6-f complex iron-sulfur subunit
MTNMDDVPNKSDQATRRDFLTKLWIGLGGLALLGYAAVTASFIRPRKRPATADDSLLLIEAGHVDTFENGSVTPFVRGKFYLCRLEDGGFLAVSRNCTHLGCTLPWDRDRMQFTCPCHASAFDIRGKVLAAPASRPLDIHPVVIENNIIRVRTGEKIRRSQFDGSQVVYAERS